MRSTAWTPEQIKAVKVFHKSRHLQEQLKVTRIKEEHVSKTGSMVFYRGRIGRRSLPHEPHWVWNQCKAQKVLEATEDHEIVLKKLNPRKKSKDNSIPFPNYKVWVFVIKERLGNREFDLNFLWCEKGNAKDKNEEEPFNPPLVPLTSIHQFAFLIDFMEPQ